MKKVFIVDDEGMAISRLRQLLIPFPDIELVGDARSVDEAVHEIVRLKPDIVFIDVELREGTAFMVIDRVREEWTGSVFIMVTAHSHYSITAIRHSVHDYLLKPVNLMDLRSAIDRLDTSLKKKSYSRSPGNEANLTPRERMVLSGMVAGKTSRIMAIEMFLSIHTVDTFRRKVLKKMGVKNTLELIASFNGVSI